MTADLAAWLMEQFADDNMPDLHLRTCQTLKPVPAGTPAIVGDRWTCDCGMVDWWLADAAAKRRLVEGFAGLGDFAGEGELPTARWGLELLALPLADREGYLEEWKP
jgi:hypothetical protein